jgi:hypothetical protein
MTYYGPVPRDYAARPAKKTRRELITKADMLKSALSVVVNDKIVDGADMTLRQEWTGKWCDETWWIKSDRFEVWCNRTRHRDGRIRDVSTDVSGQTAYAVWLARNYPDVAKTFDVVAPEGAEIEFAAKKTAVGRNKLNVRILAELGSYVFTDLTGGTMLKMQDVAVEAV